MTLAAAAILTAIEEVCLGTIGSVETVTAGTVERGAYQPVDDDRIAAAARTKPRFEVEWKGERDTGLVPRMSSHASYEIKLLVRLVYPTDFELQPDERRAQRAAGAVTANKIRNALTRPGNLTQTSAAVATELASGCLKKAETAVVREDFKRRVWIAEIACTALVCTTR